MRLSSKFFRLFDRYRKTRIIDIVSEGEVAICPICGDDGVWQPLTDTMVARMQAMYPMIHDWSKNGFAACNEHKDAKMIAEIENSVEESQIRESW